MTNKRFYLNKKGNIIDVISDSELRYIEDMQVIVDLLNELAEENERLKTKNTAYLQDIEMFKEKNTELQLRNDRQAETIGELYNLIEKNDWKALQQIIQDFKDCEEQLRKEWKRYE